MAYDAIFLMHYYTSVRALVLSAADVSSRDFSHLNKMGTSNKNIVGTTMNGRVFSIAMQGVLFPYADHDNAVGRRKTRHEHDDSFLLLTTTLP